MYEIIYDPDNLMEHRCELTPAEDMAEGTIVRCFECRRKWRVWPYYTLVRDEDGLSTFSSHLDWWQVRWWHFRTLWRIWRYGE